MKYIETLDELHALYGTPGDAAMRKVANRMTPEYRRWIMSSRFCVLSTVGPNGTDATPRGDDGPVVQEIDQHTLAMADWRGNQRLDNLRNIVRDPRISLMFFVPGSNNVVRINGEGRITTDPEMLARFAQKNRRPATVIVFKIGEVYSQCARAFVRAKLWTSGDKSESLPTVGQILTAMTAGEVGGQKYDDKWDDRAAKTMW